MTSDGFKVFDSDLHVCEPLDLWERYIDPRFKDQAPRGIPTTGPFSSMCMTHEGKMTDRQGSPGYADMARVIEAARRHGRLEQFVDFERRGWGPDVQLEAMDVEGIDAAVLYPSRGLSANAKEFDDDELALAIARAYNDWLAEFCAAAPDRLLGAGMVHPQSIKGAIAEARRMKADLGFKAIYIRPNPVRGRNWHNPAYDPLWAECEKQGLVVGFHEGKPCTLPHAIAERFDGRHELLWATDHVARHPMEMMYAALCMIMGGVLERFPALRVGFLEANCSWVPYWLWRMEEHYEAIETQIKGRVPRRPTEYFERQCYVCVESEETTAGPAIEGYGENIVYSTDFPHGDSAYPHSVATFLGQAFPAEAKRKILWDNCARLYDLG
jgi:predicted TIM-barrel fold metal-dependent hydrolase